MDSLDAPTIRCPTCRAEQDRSEVCRRCKSDLRLLCAAADDWRRLRDRCLGELQAGRPSDALRNARECLRLRNDAESRSLIAVCELLHGNWTAAVRLATQDRAQLP